MNAGCPRLAYPNIVGSGNQSTILHYEKNDQILKNGDLVLVDAGGEKNMMSADITRTWPVNGRFTPPQCDIYELVLEAQMSTINLVKPGVTFAELQEQAKCVIKQGLKELGFTESAIKYYPHYIGHWLGMDVHDCQGVDRETRSTLQLEPGHVITIEPGIYLPEDDQNIPKAYRGIGVRIEDDVLVTKNGCEVLSSLAPKDVDEIEALVGQSHKTHLFTGVIDQMSSNKRQKTQE